MAMKPLPRIALLTLLATMGSAHAATYTVKSNGSGGDPNTNDTTCSSVAPANADTCTLRAAIEQGNAKAGPHTIKFDNAVTKVTLSASLPTVLAPVTLDGTVTNAASGGRVEIDGAMVNGCFSLSDGNTAVNPNGARGSTVKNFVVRRCQGNGISLSGHGYTVTGNRVGTNPGATSGSSASDANSGTGISVSGTIPVPGSLPAGAQLASLISTLPQSFAGVQALAESLKAALTVVAMPNVIAGNVVSGNSGIGIEIFGQSTVNNIVSGNIVGLSQDGLSAVPNGRGPGGPANKAGIRVTSTAWGNFIGPGNIVSGNLGDGITIDTGSVILPNFVAGNLVGLGSAPVASVGNAESGVFVDARLNGNNDAGFNNPTGLSAIIGPANTISDNKAEPPSSDLDVEGGDTAGGLLTSGNSDRIKIFANVVGLATFPAGATPLGQLQYGNVGNGMIITGTRHSLEKNLVLANGRHGVLLRGGTGHVIRGNYIGVSVPTGLSPFINLGNGGDGIHIINSGSTAIGGTGANDANFIAANGRHGIALRGSNAWANLITRNRIYGNARTVGAGIGIDLENPTNAPDDLDRVENPSTNYANHDQHRPSICGGANDPPACAGADAPVGPGSGGSGTSVQWTITTRPNASNTIRVEFFANAADGSDQTYLGEKLISTDANGRPTGGGCSAGLCTSSVGGSTGTAGMQIVATATDLTLADVPPTNDQPPVPNSASNNTSEFSDVASATPRLEITTQPPLPPGDTDVPYAGVTFAATGGSGTYVDWDVSNGTLPNGLSLAAGTGVLSGTPTVANTFNFTVQVTDSAGAEATAAYAITVALSPPLMITTASPLAAGTVGVAYGPLNFAASGGNGAAGNWQIQSGDLPAGLSLSTAGVLSGTPTQVGTYEFNVRTTDQQPTTVVKAFSLTIAPAPVPLAISTVSPLPDATATVTYATQTFAATGGSGIYTAWAVTAGSLPDGLSLGATNGQLSGKPTTAGAYNFSVRVTDSSAATATKAFALNVNAAPPPPPTEPVFTATPSDIDFGEVTVGRTAFANVRLTNRSTSSNYTPRLTQPPANSGFSVDYGTCDDAAGDPITLMPNQFCTMMVAFTPTASDGAQFSSSSRCLSHGTDQWQLPVHHWPALTRPGAPDLSRHRRRHPGAGGSHHDRLRRAGAGFQHRCSGDPHQSHGREPVLRRLLATGVQQPEPVQPAGQQLHLRHRHAVDALPVDLPLCPRGAGPGRVFDPYHPDPTRLGHHRALRHRVARQRRACRRSDPSVPRGAGFRHGQHRRGGADPGGDAQPDGSAHHHHRGTVQRRRETTWSRFTFFGCANPIDPNATEDCTWIYGFSPKVAGDYATNSEIISTDGGGQTFAVPLSLSGVGVGSLVQVTPKVLDVGQVNLGDIGRGFVTITNTSADELTLSFSGAFPFSQSDTCAATLAADASCTITYALSGDGDPLGPVASQATLLFDAGSGLSESVTIDLSGNLINVMFRDGFE
jgi:hypothetical protein